MKRSILKILIWILSFFAALYICGKIMNKENINLTADMSISTLPIVTIDKSGMQYNQLHGYLTDMDVSYQLESITELGEDRELSFEIRNYGVKIDSVYVQVRTVSGDRLIENTQVSESENDTGKIICNIRLKDLIEKDTEYALTILLLDAQGREIRYYTRVIWSDSTKASEKLRYVKDFHEKTFDKDRVKTLSQYMESNSRGDNTTLHKVDIHSSLDQLSYGDMSVHEVGSRNITIKELSKQTATICVDFMLENDNNEFFSARETFRIRLTTDRVYLLSYEREMNQFLTREESVVQGDKIGIGITNPDMQIVENEDGSHIAFVSNNCLYGYDLTGNSMAVIFSFYDRERSDERDLYNNNTIKILKVNTDGDVTFAVYGYMNRGLHEGEVGMQLSVYHKNQNTIEEIIYVPGKKSAEILQADLEKLLYCNENGDVYYYMDRCVYKVNTTERKEELVTKLGETQELKVSSNHNVIAWTKEDTLYVLKLDNAGLNETKASANEKIYPLSFMGEDIIYGVLRTEDIYTKQTGQEIRPMYQICIVNTFGKKLKVYEQDGIYVTECNIEGNQISLEQVKKDSQGNFVSTVPEQIVSNESKIIPKNTISVVAIDVYEQFVQIKLKGTSNNKKFRLLTPKWVVYEEERVVEQQERTLDEQWYVYGKGQLLEVCVSPAKAISLAYTSNGFVTDATGQKIWVKGNRVTKNQIMAIKERKCAAGETSLMVCLETILELEGISKDVPMALSQGKTAIAILQESLTDYEILDLEGCPLDAVLYYVNKDIPVLASVEKGQCVLVVGFNEYNVVIMEPSTGRLYKKGINDSTEWFAQNGNQFITYSK